MTVVVERVYLFVSTFIPSAETLSTFIEVIMSEFNFSLKKRFLDKSIYCIGTEFHMENLSAAKQTA